MADVAWVKRWPDGRQMVVTQLTDTEGHIRIGDKYKVMPIEQWRALPLYNEADRRS